MLPHEKELVKRLENEPFALLGMNSDGDAAKVKDILAKNGITWRQAVLGGTEAALPRLWNITGWPTLYVVDAKGVIRARDLHGEEDMENAVMKLLAEAKGAK